MIDFAKLRDPAYSAELKSRVNAREAEIEEMHQKITDALNVFQPGAVFDRLSHKEQDFVRSCSRLHRRFAELSPAQKEWLFSLSAKHAESDDEDKDSCGPKG